MKHVNYHFLDSIFGPLVGSADMDDEYEKYKDLNPNDEKEIKKIISEIVLPEFKSLPDKYKNISKDTLAYYLNSNRINFGGVFDSYLIAFDHPDDPKTYFIWAWEVLFENEKYGIEDLSLYKEEHIVNEPISIIIESRGGNPNEYLKLGVTKLERFFNFFRVLKNEIIFNRLRHSPFTKSK